MCSSLLSVILLVLSGLGFENGGLGAAHAIGTGLTALEGIDKNYLHGELVALGVIAHLYLENHILYEVRRRDRVLD